MIRDLLFAAALFLTLSGCDTSVPTPTHRDFLFDIRAMAQPPDPDTLLSTSPAGKIQVDKKLHHIVGVDFVFEEGHAHVVLQYGTGQMVLVRLNDDEEPTALALLRGDQWYWAQRPVFHEMTDSILGGAGTIRLGEGEAVEVVFAVDPGAGTSTFEIHGTRAALRGTLGSGTKRQLRHILKAHPTVRTIDFVDVPGSINDEVNVMTGRLLRASGLATHIGARGTAASGGVDLFLAGTVRTISPGAKLGVHSWGGSGGEEGRDFPKGHEAHDMQLAYFREILSNGESFYYYTLEAASADDVHWMTQDEILKWSLATDTEER